MNDVINKLSDIEQASVNIMDSANARKKEIAAQMADKTSSFDAQIQADTAKKLADLRTQMEVDMQAKLSKQKSDAEETLRQMEDSYAAHHTEYAQALFPVSAGAAVGLMIDWRLFVILVAVFALMALLSKRASVCSMACAVVLAAGTPLFTKEPMLIALAVFTGLLVLVMHRANIRRLLRGEEPPFHLGSRKK